MQRKKKTRRTVARTRNAGTQTEAAFFSWLRSILRRASLRWKPRSLVMKNARRKYKGPNKRRKWEYVCSECAEWKPGKEIEVDHIIPCGSLKTFGDLSGFAERLFCESDGLRVLCKACHEARKHEI